MGWVRGYERCWMSGGESDHDVAVTAWLQQAAQGRTVESLIQAFERLFAAFWQRSIVTLGEVTLTAIVERVRHKATRQYPMLASLDVDASGLHCGDLSSRLELRDDQVSAALRFVLVEFLTVLGNLTAQILTPALHAELAKGNSNASDGDTIEDQAS
jgi:hypothetical protein